MHKEKEGNSIAAKLSELTSRFIALVKPEDVDPSLRGFHHVALLRDLHDSSETEKERIVQRFLGHKKIHAIRYME